VGFPVAYRFVSNLEEFAVMSKQESRTTADVGADEELPGKWVAIGEPADHTYGGDPMLAALPGGHLLAVDGRRSWRFDRHEWTDAGNLPIDLLDREFCSLLSLNDGSVLAMGFNSDFDPQLPANNHVLTSVYTQHVGWSAPSRMVVQRASYAAAAMRDGRVLAAGGFDVTQADPAHNQAFTAAELYDTEARMWRETVPMNTPRLAFALAVSPFGRSVYAFGGSTRITGAPDLDTVESYVEEEGVRAWIPRAPMSVPRKYPSALTLPDGRIVVASDDTLQVYDSWNDRWEEPVALLAQVGTSPIMGLLRDGTVLVGNQQVFDPVARACRPVSPLPAATDAALTSGYCNTTLGTVVVWAATDPDIRGTMWEFDIDARR
jgi:hypothetical protein